MRGFKYIFLIICMLSRASSLNGSFQHTSSAIKIIMFPETSRDTVIINNLTRTGFKYLSQEKMIKNVKVCIDSAELICKRKNIEIPAMLNLLKAEFAFSTGDLTSAADNANKAMEQAKNTSDKITFARTMIFLGRYYLRTGLFKESMDYFDNSITLAKENKLKAILPDGYFGQADLLLALKDLHGYRQALKNMIDAAITEKDSALIIRGYSLLGTSYLDKDPDYKLADSLLRRCVEIAALKKDYRNISFSLANLGYKYYLLKEYDTSLSYYNKSLGYSLRDANNSIADNSYGNIGTIYRDLGEPDKSIFYYQKSIAEAMKRNDWYNLAWVYKDMSDMYLRIKDTSKAFESFVLHKKFNDSMLIKENSQGLSDARLRYDADTHLRQVELLSLRIKNQRLMIYGFGGMVVLIVVIGLLLLRGSKLKARRRISEMNRKISEITQANLRQQMNPHFIFNTLNSIQYYMYQHDKLATNNYLTKFSSLMRKVLENSQHTSITLHDELDALNLYLELECIRFKDKFEYKITIDEEIDTLLFKIPTMLIQPFVENSISHGLMPGKEKGFLKIDLKLEKDYISCTIEDNGIGREEAQKRKANMGTNHNSLGTQIVASRLDLVNALYGTSLKTIYTDLKNANGEAEGTRVEIHIPIIT